MAYLYKYISRPCTLATDLDGTFLGGSEDARRELYAFIEGHRHLMGLVFVTGRSFQSVQALLANDVLPQPDLLICDVGTSIYVGDGSCPMPDLQNEIARCWADGHQRVTPALAHLEGLMPQDGIGPFRKSYFYAHTPLALQGKAIVEAMGFDGLLSDDKYFDVLPRGVNKGSTLRRVLQDHGIAPESVLVAGDTLNDLSMLSLGLPSVAVGNAEKALLELLPEAPQIYRAEQHGAAGIMEALLSHPQSPPQLRR
ncbi:MAG: HAD family hydrolase [Burkholderiaceae bacterium]